MFVYGFFLLSNTSFRLLLSFKPILFWTSTRYLLLLLLLFLLYFFEGLCYLDSSLWVLWKPSGIGRTEPLPYVAERYSSCCVHVDRFPGWGSWVNRYLLWLLRLRYRILQQTTHIPSLVTTQIRGLISPHLQRLEEQHNNQPRYKSINLDLETYINREHVGKGKKENKVSLWSINVT